MSKLFQLQKRYSDRLHLKLTGGHSKYFVCDRQFAYVGSHNILSSSIPNLKVAYPDLQGDETGTIHRNQEMIQKLINRYDQAIDLTDSLTTQNMKFTAWNHRYSLDFYSRIKIGTANELPHRRIHMIAAVH